MTPTRSRLPAVALALVTLAAAMGCGERNMGSSSEKNEGWVKVDTGSRAAAPPAAPLPHADAVNVTYYYLPG